jgi:hypothetical protein
VSSVMATPGGERICQDFGRPGNPVAEPAVVLQRQQTPKN